MKILVVDDDVQIRKMLHGYLADRHEVSLLTDGHNAVSLLADVRHDFDLVFLDLSMPRLSGETVLDIIEDLVDVQTRFVIISGYMDRYRPKLEGHNNVVGFLEKPFGLGEIDHTIENAATAYQRTLSRPKGREERNEDRRRDGEEHQSALGGRR